MQRLLDDLILYSVEGHQILRDGIAVLSENIDENTAENLTRLEEDKEASCRRLIKQLMELAYNYGFDGNLWHNYMAYYIATDENPFSLYQERSSEVPPAVLKAAADDCITLRKIFNMGCTYPDSNMERLLTETIADYMYPSVSAPVMSDAGKAVSELKDSLEAAKDDDEFFQAVAGFYQKYGTGLIGINRAFTVKVDEKGKASLRPVAKTEDIKLSDLIGYELQKQRLTANTVAFIEKKPANNVLLYGDGGTGKSTSIRAIINQYWGKGLRIIQVYRHQMKYLAQIINQIKNRNYRFIIYMDDLSFEDFETEYKYLKAVIEGGLEPRPENVLIYATSNRRHLIKETWKDRNDVDYDGDIHRSDSMEEKLSLAERFGVQIYYGKPTKDEFHQMVETMAQRECLNIDKNTLHKEANKWEIRRGGVSGRSARQFIDYLKGMEEGTV